MNVLVRGLMEASLRQVFNCGLFGGARNTYRERGGNTRKEKLSRSAGDQEQQVAQSRWGNSKNLAFRIIPLKTERERAGTFICSLLGD